MYNHGRTLLLNLDGGSSPGSDFLAEELVPADYRRLTLPGYLQLIRGRLFGSDPDRAMLNYRIRQYLAVLQTTELHQFLLDLDPRITYDCTEESLTQETLFTPRIRQSSGALAALYLLGEQGSPDSMGRIRYDYEVDVLSHETVEVRRITPYPTSWISSLSLADGLSNTIDLLGTGYQFRLNTNNPATQFVIDGYLRPQWDLTQILALLQQIGETTTVQLFGVQSVEPYQTLRNLWNDHHEFAYRLGAILVALIYRTEEVRQRG